MLQKAGMEKGKLRWRTEGFYFSLESCLKGYLRRLVLESDKDLPEALVDSIQALETAVDQLKTSLTVNL